MTLPASTSSRHWPSELGLLASLFVVLAPFVWTSAFPQDEFTTLSNALRMRDGAVIYRDFFEFTAPLSHMLAAWAFALTGPSLLVARVLQAGLLAIAGWGLYHVARRFGVGAWTATLPGLLLVLALYRTLPGYNHHWVVLPFLVGALGAGMRGMGTGGGRAWAIAGALTGVATAVMQSDGLVFLMALAAARGLKVLFDGRWREGLRDGLALALGFTLPLAAVAVYFLAHGALGEAWYHVMTWPLTHYKSTGSVNDIKYATDLTALLSTTGAWINLPYWYGRAYHFLYLFALVPAMALVGLLWGLDRLKGRLGGASALTERAGGFGLLALATLAFGLLAARGKADYVHVAAYAWPAVLMAVVLADRFATMVTDPALRYVRELPRLSLWVFAITGALLVAGEARLAPREWLSAAPPDARLAARPAIQYLKTRAKPGDQVVAMPYGGFYYFYGLPPAGRYTLILPPKAGYYTPEEFRAFWDEMVKKRPRFVLFSLWNGRQALGEYLLHPLPGYREAAWVPMQAGDPLGEVGIFERVGP